MTRKDDAEHGIILSLGANDRKRPQRVFFMILSFAPAAGISLLTGAVHLGGFSDKTSPRSSNPARKLRLLHGAAKQNRPHKRSVLLAAPAAGFEPATNALTAHCSTTELHRNVYFYSSATDVISDHLM